MADIYTIEMLKNGIKRQLASNKSTDLIVRNVRKVVRGLFDKNFLENYLKEAQFNTFESVLLRAGIILALTEEYCNER